MESITPSSSPARKPWLLTVGGLFVCIGLLALPKIVGPAGAQEMPDLVRFLGHFHPVVLHLPIGVFAFILFHEMMGMLWKRWGWQQERSLVPLVFGAVSAVVAVIAGFLLYQGHGDEYAGNAIAERHLWGGLAFAVAAILTLVLKAWTVVGFGSVWIYRGLLFASVGVMGFASHDGASMTHGSDYLTIYAPDPVRRAMGLPAKKPREAAEKKFSSESAPEPGKQVVYRDIVAPILENRCVQCHKESKAKGKYRMDTYELLVKGGKEGAGLVPGKSVESNIIVRMELPEDDEEHMPPEGKADIETSEQLVVKWWIDQGADPKKLLTDFVVPAAVAEAISKISKTAVPAGPLKQTTSTAPSPAATAAFAEISKAFPKALRYESKESTRMDFSAAALRQAMDDVAFKKLQPILPELVNLDLAATGITDASVSQLAVAQNLRSLRLSETVVTDAAIETLLKISTLESLNLYGTRITDAGVSQLSALKNLKLLYLWKTTVTPKAIAELQKHLPSCRVITGGEF